MDVKKVSIILPIYNVGNYLAQCLDTIERQTYRNFEAILINDGSTDDCKEICSNYSRKDKRFKTINQDNAGVSAARNTGLKTATGDYITFIDPDDAVSDDYIETLINILQTNSVDISICDLQTVFQDISFDRDVLENETVVMNTERALERLLYQDEYDVALWGKLYKSELFNGIEFPVGEINEDTAITYKIFSKATSVAYTRKKCYFYLQHGSSIMHSSFSRQKMSLILFSDECLRFVEKNYPRIKNAAICKHVTDAFVLICKIYEADHIDKIALRECWKVIRRYRLNVITNTKSRKKTKIACLASYFGPRFVAHSKMLNDKINRKKGVREV